MEKVIPAKIKVLANGQNLIVKQMISNSGALLPKHSADVESMIFIHEGECVLSMNGELQTLKAGDAFCIPAQQIHQFKAITDFIGIHIMPKEIKFQFFD